MVGFRVIATLLFFQIINQIESKAVSQNATRTMHYYIFPMTNSEVESLQRQSRQQQQGTAINVANILAGLFQESAESDEETESPLVAPGSAAPASPQVNDPVTEKATATAPDSAPKPESQGTQPANHPESAPLPVVQAITLSPASQLKVILEDTNSIVTANVVNNENGEEKKYIYLVLLSEQYQQFEKLTAMTAASSSSLLSAQTQENLVTATQAPLRQPELFSLQEEIIEPDLPTTTTALIPETSTPVATTDSTTTVKSGGYRLRNVNRTSTIPPPHLQLQYYYRLTSTTTATTTTSTTTTTSSTASTDLPGVQGFENEDDELDN